jgi:hypothetical protein
MIINWILGSTEYKKKDPVPKEIISDPDLGVPKCYGTDGSGTMLRGQ